MKTAKLKYQRHKAQAKYRKIDFNFTFIDWYNWWLSNGVDKTIDQKWPGAARPCMCRINDTGAYELSNVYFATNAANASHSHTNGHRTYPIKKTRKPRKTMATRKNNLDSLYDLHINIDAYYDKTQKTADANGCYNWAGPKHQQGYGFIGAKRKSDGKRIMVVAHRVAARVKYGRAIDSSEMVIHSCSNPACQNQDHIFLGDAKTRTKNMWDNGRAPVYATGKHVRDDRRQNRTYKHTPEEMIWMKNHKPKEIAAKFGISVDRARANKAAYKNGYRWLEAWENQDK